ncbi:hypothetical protein GCM10010413_41520 [Promicromonospora sukumoe]|uniref:Uncharacterized protein n=1 Tax=Promicromonospora sukumoe TaxID=88382 RepID=A0A7W3JE47_9MICO|nr:hypothetical protein [Promicromonospora sukumoe]MBA8811141.1 hypothetical protein [Promicromonospora sukumoe]
MSHDDLNDRSDQNDFLSGALHGAADAMPGGEVNDLHVSFGVVRDRVRRRRAVKVGSLAGASLAVAGVLAFGVTQSPVWNSEPVLPGSPTENVAPNRSADPSPSGPPATSVIQDGYVPSWIDGLGVGLSCGMPVDDLGSTTDTWSATSIGDIYSVTSELGGEPSTSLGMAASVEGTEGSVDVPPVLVWSQDGVVVDLGPNVFDGSTLREPLVGSAGNATEAQDSALTSCAPTETETRDTFQTSLPEGDYEVRVVAFPQLDSGDWATAVSEPVAVRLDADGAHSPTGTRGGDATIEPPERAEGELTRMVLDRSTSWVSAQETQFGYVTTGTPVITAECESTDPADVVSIEVVQPSTDESFATFDVPCDGERFVSDEVVGGGSEEVVDLRLASVPDGVSRFWATLAPNADGSSGGGGGADAAGACSADGLDLPHDPPSSPSAAAGATAQAVLDAALACDQDRLVELATQYPTELLVPAQPAEEVFALPEDDALHYLTVAGLLAGTVGADRGDGTVVWPRVATEEFRDSDEAWDEAVEAGLLTQGEADAQRADETFGYTGMGIAIDDAGNWRYYSATP